MDSLQSAINKFWSSSLMCNPNKVYVIAGLVVMGMSYMSNKSQCAQHMFVPFMRHFAILAILCFLSGQVMNSTVQTAFVVLAWLNTVAGIGMMLTNAYNCGSVSNYGGVLGMLSGLAIRAGHDASQVLSSGEDLLTGGLSNPMSVMDDVSSGTINNQVPLVKGGANYVTSANFTTLGTDQSRF